MEHKRDMKKEDRTKQAGASQSGKIRNIIYSEAEEDLFSELVLKHGKVLLDKTTNMNSNEQKKDAWQLIEREFNSSSLSKTFRSAKNLLSKYKNIKASLRKGYAANKLARHLTGGGQAPPDIDGQLSGAKQKLHAAIALTIEGLAPNGDDDEVQVAAPNCVSETYPINSEADEELTQLGFEIIQLAPEECFYETSEQNGSTAKAVDTHTETVQTGTNNGVNQQCHEIQKKKTIHARLLKKTKKNKNNTIQLNALNYTECVANAKALFYKNEEKRAAERHELQMHILHAEREEKRAIHEKCLEEHRFRIQLLNAQIGTLNRKRSRVVSRSRSSSNTYSPLSEN